MKVLIVGGGAREHALAVCCARDKRVTQLFCAPGNPGIGGVAELVAIPVNDVPAIVEFSKANSIELVIVGPEYPLSLGLGDALRKAGIPTFGPSRDGALLESSKRFSKEIMNAAGVRTPRSIPVTSKESALLEIKNLSSMITVLKADGLASGKGVVICKDPREIEEGLKYVFDILGSETVLVEEYLRGVEASYIVATNGLEIVPLPSSHDYKRIFDGNLGPNTGGMGSISPTPYLDQEALDYARDRIVAPVLKELRHRGIPYVGFLYAGLMIPDGELPYVIEFNVRLGDPETQVILERLETPLLDVLYPFACGENFSGELKVTNDFVACVVMASSGYPDDPKVGDVIEGLDKVAAFHAGTSLNSDGSVVTSGGRVLSVIGKGSTQESAVARAYERCNLIKFNGSQFRRDIGSDNG